MKNLLLVSLLCAALVPACKKKSADTTATGSGSAMVVEGSAMAPAPAMAGSAEGSAAMGSAGSAATVDGTVTDPEGSRHWNCKAICKRALDCKAKIDMNEKTCEQDCTNLAKDKDGRYARGAGESARFYTCVAKATDCPDVLGCLKPAP